MPGCDIRRAVPNDVAALKRMIDALAAINHVRADVTEEQLRANAFGSGALLEALVADDAGSLAGYAFWYATFDATSGTRVGHLHHLFVHEAWRARGLGRELVFAVIRHVLDARCIGLALNVAPENAAAIGFYRRLGFEPEEPRQAVRFSMLRDKAADIVLASR